ncbi:MAG: class I SAM-dependent methyltransferase [Candidatus Pacearchaeota archaeon]
MNQEEIWNEIAVHWKEFRTKISPTVEKFLREKKGRVLDIGCGSGRNFIKIKGLKWFGIDFSKKMLDYAKISAKNKGINIELKKSDSVKIPYEDNYFNYVLCYAVLHCVDSDKKREETIKEIYRVLKPKSQALISVWGKNSPRLRSKEKECFVPWTVKEKTKINRYTYIYDKKELEEIVENIGFKILKSWEERNINLIIQKDLHKS